MKITVSTNKFGVNLGSFEIEPTEAQIAWAVGNGFSQAATDTHASDTEEAHGSKEKAIEEAKASFASWVAKMQSGHVPAAGGGGKRLPEDVKALREAFALWIGKPSVVTKLLKDHSGNIEDAVFAVASAKVEKDGNGDAVAMTASRMAKLQESAEKLLAAKQSAKKAVADLEF
jgi:hypothetical protein